MTTEHPATSLIVTNPLERAIGFITNIGDHQRYGEQIEAIIAARHLMMVWSTSHLPDAIMHRKLGETHLYTTATVEDLSTSGLFRDIRLVTLSSDEHEGDRSFSTRSWVGGAIVTVESNEAIDYPWSELTTHDIETPYEPAKWIDFAYHSDLPTDLLVDTSSLSDVEWIVTPGDIPMFTMRVTKH